jgi:hypothetical protein
MQLQSKYLAAHLAFFAAAILVMPLELAAQVCRGGVSFATSALQGQAAVEVEPASTVYGMSGGKGDRRWYGLGTLAVRSYESRDGQTVIFGFGGGRTFTNRRTGRAQHCLELRAEFGTGPDAPGMVRADESSSNMTLEFTTGVPITAGRSLVVTPFGGLAARYASVVIQGDESSESIKDFYELLTLGFGLTLGGDYAVQPYAQFPLGRDEGGDPVFGMKVSLNFGARR